MKYVLTDIPGIGESTAALLIEHGIDSVKVLRKTALEQLCTVPGFDYLRAKEVQEAADVLQAQKKALKRAAAYLKAGLPVAAMNSHSEARAGSV
ncbi:MAG: hypothetical protein COS35_04750 [Zetaproteobacteria bacterium CG02_land_8_20_14_3_00_50_9]|nr:MAG: hypothetical protein COW62_07690 [Zetaproteobacteria bacterium CG17_big_fil_post_rev_8_21_14_2_50_50_13]PIV30804.1 MAG: hypothetical protein COS35_04750 [Zetaproteobacteria bacterium CG02_land_8_20_14_3_00_50_9]PIY56815.1 MAG: hypothetical protein COZ00_02315 [Zetaproteobacteria bacterium CG_4_10_14_0_8_um_filter_49_80]